MPALIATGAAPDELMVLVRDGVLAIFVLRVALRAADVWVPWPVVRVAGAADLYSVPC